MTSLLHNFPSSCSVILVSASFLHPKYPQIETTLKHPKLSNPVIILCQEEGRWFAVNSDHQDMGLRYFDRVVVVSAGRFTEMEAHDGPWIGITDVPQEIQKYPESSRVKSDGNYWKLLHFRRLVKEIAMKPSTFLCCILFGLSSAGRASGRTGATQRSILHGEDKGGSRHRQ